MVARELLRSYGRRRLGGGLLTDDRVAHRRRFIRWRRKGDLEMAQAVVREDGLRVCALAGPTLRVDPHDGTDECGDGDERTTEMW